MHDGFTGLLVPELFRAKLEVLFEVWGAQLHEDDGLQVFLQRVVGHDFVLAEAIFNFEHIPFYVLDLLGCAHVEDGLEHCSLRRRRAWFVALHDEAPRFETAPVAYAGDEIEGLAFKTRHQNAVQQRVELLGVVAHLLVQ